MAVARASLQSGSLMQVTIDFFKFCYRPTTAGNHTKNTFDENSASFAPDYVAVIAGVQRIDGPLHVIVIKYLECPESL